MKIGILSDLHLPVLLETKMEALKSILNEIDCLVMGGDNVELEGALLTYETLFSELREQFKGPIAFVTGHHELIGNLLRSGVSISFLKEIFPIYSEVAHKYDVTHLEEENLNLGEITICGTYGHYDGSLSGKNFPEDYSTVSKLVSALENRVQDVKGKIILVTHTVPNKAMIGRPDGPVQDKYTPYAGSLQLEDLIGRLKPVLYFCGHTHAPAHSIISGVPSFNIGTDYKNFFYFVVDTPDMSVKEYEINLF